LFDNIIAIEHKMHGIKTINPFLRISNVSEYLVDSKFCSDNK
jgi:hypothetical protein